LDQETPVSTDAPAGSYKHRRAARTAVSANARMHPQNWYSVEVKIRDLSNSGFMAECPETVRIGGYVALDVPGVGQVDAQVRWQIGGRMGGLFLNPISLARCEWVAVKTETPQEAA